MKRMKMVRVSAVVSADRMVPEVSLVDLLHKSCFGLSYVKSLNLSMMLRAEKDHLRGTCTTAVEVPLLPAHSLKRQRVTRKVCRLCRRRRLLERVLWIGVRQGQRYRQSRVQRGSRHRLRCRMMRRALARWNRNPRSARERLAVESGNDRRRGEATPKGTRRQKKGKIRRRGLGSLRDLPNVGSPRAEQDGTSAYQLGRRPLR